MAVFLYEFLYRGRSSDGQSAWHVILRDEGIDGFGRPTSAEMVLNMAQAEEANWPLPRLIEAINTGAMAEVEKLRTDVAERDDSIRTAENRIAALSQEKDSLVAAVADRDRSIAELTGKYPTPANPGAKA